MSEPRARAAAAAPDFTELWRNVSVPVLSDGTHERTSGPRHVAAAAAASTMRTELQSPKHRSRYAGWSSGDSPGDVEPTQDIFWDSTSPTSAAAGSRNSRFVEISDIVNRIAPKDVKRKAAESPLLQWIGDSAVPWTQAAPKPRVRKRSSRQSSVDDLLKLARQFDENMQQDRETSELLAAAGAALSDRAEAPEPANAQFTGDLKAPPPSDPVEAELRALFDCSTQRISGRLSQGSAASSAAARSQETKRQPELKSSGGSAEGKGSCAFKADDFNDDFDDDWDDDDLLDDSFALAMSRDLAPRRDAHRDAAKTNSGAFTSVCEPPARPRPSALQELCPETKTSNRSTFRLQPNPHFQTEPKPKTSDLKPAAAKTRSMPIPDKTETETSVAPVSSDSLWDDGVDDALLCQACDRVERTGSQSPGGRQEKPAGNAKRSFVRCNSLPEGGGGGTGSYQGWGVPMKGASGQAGMSQSLPGSRGRLGSFNRPDMKPHKAGTAKSHQPAFKRGVAEPAAVSSKVFVTSQQPLKCSAAEIGRKKQEALARRRLRLQSATKP